MRRKSLDFHAAMPILRSMRRAIRVTLKFATQSKRRRLQHLIAEYQRVVNFYIRSLWQMPGGLNAQTRERLPASKTRCSFAFRNQAVRQALGIIRATKNSAKGRACSMPIFNGAPVLGHSMVLIQDGCGSFDLVVRLSGLSKGNRITIPTRKTQIFNKWISRSGARLIQGCTLGNDHLVLWVDVPERPTKKSGKRLGIDIGIHKLLTDSDGKHYGTEFKTIRDKIRRRKPGSRNRWQACQERKNYINQIVNRLPWTRLSILGVEHLTGLKTGKQKGRGKAFRKAVAPWTYRQVLNRIECKAQENRVRLVAIDPANTSRTCPICGTVRRDNRRGEGFACLGCGYTADADSVAARNILARTLATLGSVESPKPKKAMA